MVAGETAAWMQSCDVIIGGTETSTGTYVELRERLGLSSRSPLKPTKHSTSPWLYLPSQQSSSIVLGPCLSFNQPPAPGPAQLHCHGGGEMAASSSPPAALRQPTLAMDIAKYRQKMETWKTV